MSDEPDIDDAGGTRGQQPAAARPRLAPPAKPVAPRLPPPPAFPPPKLASAGSVEPGTSASARPAAKPASVAAAPKPTNVSAASPKPAKVSAASPKPANVSAASPKPANVSASPKPAPKAASASAPPSKPASASASATVAQKSAGASALPSKPAVASIRKAVEPSIPPKPASPRGARAGGAEAPSLDALRRGTAGSPRPTAATPVPVGLPPPPEFLARSSSAELPLERWAGGDASEQIGPVTLTGIPPLRLDDPEQLGPATLTGIPPLRLDEPPAGDDVHTSPGSGHALLGTSNETEAPREADDGVDIDMDVSEDTLPRVVPVTALREAYPALPVAPSQVPTAPVAVLDDPEPSTTPVPRSAPMARAAPAVARGRTARVLEAPPEPPRSLGLWLAVGAAAGAVISIVALLWITSSSAEQDPSPDPEPPSTAAPTVEPKADVVPEPMPVPEAKVDVVVPEPGPSAPEAKANVVPEPDEPPVEPVPDEPPDEEASIITVERDPSEYQRAAADYAATGSQEALLDMTTAACALREGPRARAAFRKLIGKTLRTKAIVACNEVRVDVTSTVDGYTGPELLAQARAALADGDAKTALDKAHQSNKVERSSDAVLLKGLAACKLGDGEQARRLVPHVSIKHRPQLVLGCKEAGIELRG